MTVARLEQEALPSRLRRLRLLAIGAPIVAVLCVDYIVQTFLEDALGIAVGHLVGAIVIALMAAVFTIALFLELAKMQLDLARKNRELATLNVVGTKLSGPNDLDRALEDAMEAVRALTGAEQVQLLPPGDTRVPARTPASAPIFPSGAMANGNRENPGRGAIASTSTLTTTQAVSETRIPLTVGGQDLGSVRLRAADGQGLWLGDGEQFPASLGRQFAAAVHAGGLFRDISQRNENAKALHEAGLVLSQAQFVQDVLDTAAHQARHLLGVRVATAYVGTLDHPRMRSAAPVQPLVADATIDCEPTSCPSCPLPDDPGRFVCAPLRIGGAAVGGLCACSGLALRNSSRDNELLIGLADLTSTALNNCWLHERERRVAVLEERERISREMHDSLAQALGYIRLKSEAIRRTVQRDLAAADAELQELRDVAHDAYKDVREGILGLRERLSTKGSLANALAEYAAKFTRSSGIRTTVETAEGDPPPVLEPDVELQVIRVVQEALTNVRKHAGARSAVIRLGHLNGEAFIAIDDDGRGFDPELLKGRDLHFGLRTMEERLERVGGRLTIDSAPGQGTTILALLGAATGGLNGANSRALSR